MSNSIWTIETFAFGNDLLNSSSCFATDCCVHLSYHPPIFRSTAAPQPTGAGRGVGAAAGAAVAAGAVGGAAGGAPAGAGAVVAAGAGAAGFVGAAATAVGAGAGAWPQAASSAAPPRPSAQPISPRRET